MTAFTGIIVGVVASGLIQTILAYLDRRREAASVLRALQAEAASILDLAERRGYRKALVNHLAQIDNDVWPGSLTARISDDYFMIYTALAENLGSIEIQAAFRVVRFYALCKSIRESLSPEGLLKEGNPSQDAVENLKSAQKKMLEDAFELGKKITSACP